MKKESLKEVLEKLSRSWDSFKLFDNYTREPIDEEVIDTENYYVITVSWNDMYLRWDLRVCKKENDESE